MNSMNSFNDLCAQHAEKITCWDQLQELRERFTEEVLRGLEKDRILFQQEKLASVGQLAAGVAHEINNPIGFILSDLRSLSGYVENFTQYLGVMDVVVDRFCPDDQKAHLAELRRTLDIDFICSDIISLIRESSEGANRIKQIVMDLKDFAQVDEAQIKDNDINQCVRRTLNVIKHELRMVPCIELQLTEMQPIPCNAQQINQLLTSLLLNAAQAMEGEGAITIKTWQEQQYAMLSVTDTGSGIAPEIAKRIFEPFFTTKTVGNGTGLGLTVAYDIVRKHEGELRLESEPGKGSTFTVCLPLQRQVGEV